MLELLSNYALFAAKTITIVTVITIPFFILLSGRKNNRKGQEPTVIIRHVNEKIDQTIRHFDAIFLSEKDYKKKKKAAQKQEKINAKNKFIMTRIVVLFESFFILVYCQSIVLVI